jgi:hypothetical protein
MGWFRVLILGLVFSFTGLAQIPVKITDGSTNERITAAAGKSYDSTITTLTNSAVVLTGTKTYVQLIFCANTTAGAVTLTITDNQGSPATYFPAVSLPANSVTALYNSPIGLPMQGIKWNASANNSVNCQLVGVQ